MSLRVHKALGYGLLEFPLAENAHLLDEARHVTADDYLAFLLRTADRIMDMAVQPRVGGHVHTSREVRLKIQLSYLETEKAWLRSFPRTPALTSNRRLSLGASFARSTELTGAVPLVLVPPSLVSEWTRVGSLIDYVSEAENHGAEDHVDALNRGIYPFDRHEVPCTVAALLLWLGKPELWPSLHEMLYTYWS